MMFMKVQSTRVGKLQLELDRDQLAALISWLAVARAATGERDGQAAITEFVTWLKLRAVRRWGGSHWWMQSDR